MVDNNLLATLKLRYNKWVKQRKGGNFASIIYVMALYKIIKQII